MNKFYLLTVNKNAKKPINDNDNEFNIEIVFRFNYRVKYRAS